MKPTFYNIINRLFLRPLLLNYASNLIRKSLLFITLFFSGSIFSQTTPLSFTQIPITDPDMNRPGGGAEQWIDQNTVNIPTEGVNTTRLDAYYRFNWLEFQSYNSAANNYTWTAFDNQINDAINNGQKFSFGIMTICGSCPNNYMVGGYGLQYPLYLHNQMQAESVKDWGSSVGGVWIPNWNSNSYLTALENLNAAINDHINNTSYKGVLYKNVIGYIDIRHYGNWGEWHHSFLIDDWSDFPYGTAATVTSLKRLIDAHVNKFPNFQLVMLQNCFDANRLPQFVNNPIEAGYHALTVSNNVGKVGWRRDNWGWTDTYISYYAEASKAVMNGLRFDTCIMNRYKYAPVVGEPADLGNAYANGVNFSDLVRQIQYYHANSFGNGNLDASESDMVAKNAFRAASKAAGHRIILESGTITSSISTGIPFSLALKWRNLGASPTYENWNVIFELRNASNTTLWSGTSIFKPRLFLPITTSTTYTDNITLPSTIPQGNYNLYVIIKDPNNYRKPLPLAIKGRGADGSYLIANFTLNQATTNNPPIVNAGADQTITLPTNTVTFNGSGTDSDGTISTYNWSKISGPGTTDVIQTPATAATIITGLAAGIYLYKLTATDNKSASTSDTVSVTVNPAATTVKPPVANAGIDQTITLPTNSITLNGNSSTTSNGSISAYAWTKIEGPVSFNILTAGSAITTVNNLVQGVYKFRLLVIDNTNLTASDTVVITVNPSVAVNKPPVANAGADQTINLPNTSVTLDGSTSSDANGTITAYAWTKIAGPTSFNIVTAGSAITTVNNLAQGVYTFRLLVMDNENATASDTVVITVDPATAVNKPPVANAGVDQTITLPINTVTLNGSSSTDPNGSITAYAWTKIAGPTSFNIVTAGSAITTVNNLVQGVYSFRLLVMDNDNATAADTVVINVITPVNKIPIANAGIDQTITLPTNTITLDGSSSSDANGSITAYSWTKIAGPASFNIITAGSAITTVNNLVQGEYTFRLLVMDNDNATAADTVVINVMPAVNKIPVANAGTDQTITLPVNTVTLDGSSSSDANGSIIAHSWTKIAGPASFNIVAAGNAITTVNNLVQGVYTFRLLVMDNDNATAADTVIVTVNAPAPVVNKPPIANAGNNVVITLPTNSASLNGSNSTDIDGNITAYSWSKIGGPAQGGGIANLGGGNAIVSNLLQGTYTFRLQVTDNQNATGADTVLVTVNPAPNTLPVANAGPDQTITLPLNTVNLSAGNSNDADGAIVAYAWTKITGPSQGAISNMASENTSVVNLIQGEYTFRLLVMDNKNGTSADTVKITVNSAVAEVPNQLPNANAGVDIAITLPTNATTLNGSASSDPDGTISNYTWNKISGPAQFFITNAGLVNTTLTNLVQGVYAFRLQVRDNQGARAYDTVTVIVNAEIPPPANQLPIAHAGADISITLPLDATSVDGSASTDPDGTISAYAWTKISGPNSYNIENSSTATTTINNLTQGEYLFKLQVRDNLGGKAYDTIKIVVNGTVTPVNKLPIADAGTDMIITLPTSLVILNGNVSSDPDGSIVAYNWTKISGPAQYYVDDASASNTLLSNLQEGEYVFQLSVTDNNNATTTDNVVIKVLPEPAVNQLPVANPGTAISITLPINNVNLNGSLSVDPDGNISAYEWTKISGPISFNLVNPNAANTPVVNLVEGEYIFKLQVTDNDNARTSNTVTVTVHPGLPPANQPPIANAGIDTTITLPTNKITLNGILSSDPDGTINAYAWNKISGPDGNIVTNGNTVSPTIINLVKGEYVFQLKVTDDKGATAIDRVTIKVNKAENIMPIADAGKDTVVSIPNNKAVVLKGTNSVDPDGSIEKYIWIQVSGPAPAVMSNSISDITQVSNLIAGEYVFELKVTDNDNAYATATVKIKVINDPKIYQFFKVYPNPTNNNIPLRVNYIEDKIGNIKIIIYDLIGKKLIEESVSKNEKSLTKEMNITTLKKGLHYLQIVHTDGTVLNSTFIVQ